MSVCEGEVENIWHLGHVPSVAGWFSPIKIFWNPGLVAAKNLIALLCNSG